MTPLDALAGRLLPTIEGIAESLEPDELIARIIAREALRWVEEQLPGREETGLILENAYGDSFSPEGRDAHEQAADALLALLREKLKGEKT